MKGSKKGSSSSEEESGPKKNVSLKSFGQALQKRLRGKRYRKGGKAGKQRHLPTSPAKIEKMAASTNHVNNTAAGGDRPLLLSQCKKVFIQRDYSQGLTVRFPVKLPQELQNRIDEHTFEKTVSELNRVYEEAERIGTASFGETLIGCLSCYLAQYCMKTQYDKCLQKIAKFLKEQNDTEYVPQGLFVTDPIERGLRVLEITILHQDENP